MCLSVDELWKYNGKTVKVEFHNFFPFPRHGTQAECGISVVIVWNMEFYSVELVRNSEFHINEKASEIKPCA